MSFYAALNRLRSSYIAPAALTTGLGISWLTLDTFGVSVAVGENMGFSDGDTLGYLRTKSVLNKSFPRPLKSGDIVLAPRPQGPRSSTGYSPGHRLPLYVTIGASACNVCGKDCFPSAHHCNDCQDYDLCQVCFDKHGARHGEQHKHTFTHWREDPQCYGRAVAGQSSPLNEFVVSIFHDDGQRLIPHYVLAVPGDKVEPPSSEYFKRSVRVPPGCVVTREYGSPELTLWEHGELLKDSAGLVLWNGYGSLKKQENGALRIIFRESLNGTHDFELPNDEYLFRYSDLFAKRTQVAYNEAREQQKSKIIYYVMKEHQKTLHDVEEVCAGVSNLEVAKCALRYSKQRRAMRIAEVVELGRQLNSSNTASGSQEIEAQKRLEAARARYKEDEKTVQGKTTSEVSERQVEEEAESQVSEVQKVRESAATKTSADTSAQEPQNR